MEREVTRAGRRLVFRVHAIRRMFERGISVEQVGEVLDQGESMEQFAHPRQGLVDLEPDDWYSRAKRIVDEILKSVLRVWRNLSPTPATTH